jgi:hypothetical protein
MRGGRELENVIQKSGKGKLCHGLRFPTFCFVDLDLGLSHCDRFHTSCNVTLFGEVASEL